MALPNLFIEQGIYKIDRLCPMGASSKYITGFLMRDSLEYLTLEVGLPGNVFAYPASIWKSLATDYWLKCAWEFQEKFNITVTPTTPHL